MDSVNISRESFDRLIEVLFDILYSNDVPVPYKQEASTILALFDRQIAEGVFCGKDECKTTVTIIAPSFQYQRDDGTFVLTEISEKIISLQDWFAIREILNSTEAGRMISAIKKVRQITNWGLRESKLACEHDKNWESK